MKAFNRRDFLAGSVLGSCAALLAACGAPAAEPTKPAAGAATKPTEAPAAKPAASKKDVTLRFITRGGAQGDHQREFGKRYAEQSGVKVESEEIPWNDIPKKIQTQIISGDMPDVVPTDNTWYPELAIKKSFLVLDDLVKASPPPNFEDYPFLEWCRIWSEGKLTGLSGECGVANGVVFYNKTMLKEVGGKEPTNDWTFEEYTSLIDQVAKKKGVLGGAYQTDGGPQLDAMIRNWGHFILDSDRKKVELTHPQTIEALTWLSSMVEKKLYPGRADNADIPGLFGAGKLFSFTTSPAQNQSVVASTKDKFEYGAVLAPKGRSAAENPPRRVFSPFANRHCISAKTKYPEESYGLLLKTTGYECMKWLTITNGKQPGILTAWRDPEVLKKYPIFKDIADEMAKCKDVYAVPWNTRFIEYRDRMNADLAPFLYAEKPVSESGLSEVQKKLQDIVNLPMPS